MEKETSTSSAKERFLGPGDNILDQAPFNLLRAEVIPPDFFKNPQDKTSLGQLLKTVVIYSDMSFQNVFGQQDLTGLHRRVAAWNSNVVTVMTRVREYLRQYPYAVEYLKANWLSHMYTISGEPQKHVKIVPPRTFSVYQAELLALNGKMVMDGLDQLDLGYATVHTIHKAIPGKRKINRIWRIRDAVQEKK